jgi:hypothetical protein
MNWLLTIVVASVMYDVQPQVAEDSSIEQWIPHAGKQTEILKRREFECLFGGSRGGGKTDAGLVWLVAPEYYKHPKYKGLVVRRNADDLSDWIARARAFYHPLGATFAGKTPIIKLPAGGFIKTGHLKDENAYTKYQGHEYQKILIEELTQIPREEDYLKLISSCRSTVPELKPQILSTTNPGGAGHVWVKQRFVDVAKDKTHYDKVSGRSRIFIPARIEDNPTLMDNDPGYVKFLESLPNDLRKAWRDGDWDIFAGQYFKKLRKSIHLCEPFVIPGSWTKFRSLDWGYGHNTVCLWWAVDHNSPSNAYIYRRYIKNETVVSEMAQNILDMTPKNEQIQTTASDPAIWVKNPYSEAPTDKTMADVIRTVGLHIEKANNNRINGWQALRELLEWSDDKPSPRLHIFETCEDVFDGLSVLVHNEKKPEDVLKVGGDDIGDCARYGAMHLYAALAPEKDKSKEDKFIESIVTDQVFAGEPDNSTWDNV